jgi:hypothetical protein
MTGSDDGLFHEGGTQAFGALVAAIATAAIVFSASSQGEGDGRLAVAGVICFAVALGLGSARVVGACSFPVLGSALISSASADQTAWFQSIAVGCLWYVAVELAWDSIERRTPAVRSPAVQLRRVNEVSSVVLISLAVTVSAYLASTLDAARTPGRQGLILVAVISALGLTVRHLASTAPSATSD